MTGHWTMDDNASNATVVDSVGSHSGTFSDSTDPNTSYHHSEDFQEGTGSLIFDGVDDYVTISRSSVLEIGNASTHQLSVSAWIKHDLMSSPSKHIAIVGTGDGGWFLGSLPDDNTLIFACWLLNGSSGQTAVATSSTPIFDGQWHHVTGVFDGSSVHLYVDDNHGELSTIGGGIRNMFDNPVLIGENGGVTGRHWDGLIDDVKIYDYALTPGLPGDANYASIPSPGDNATDVGIDDDLSFTAGSLAISHDVYFGTSEAAVTAASRLAGDVNGNGSVDIHDLTVLAQQWLGTPVEPYADLNDDNDVDLADLAVISADWLDSASSIYKGNQAGTTFDPGTMINDTTYYWRIDEVNDAESDSPWKGDIWSFTTASLLPSQALNPTPIDEANSADIDIDLSWTAGVSATSHDVYFGTTSTPAFQGNQAAVTFDPGTMEYDKAYYWRIDEVNAYGTTAGENWSFTTASEVRDLYADSWVATDALGRSLPGYDQCGPPRENRFVALFYFIWHGEHGTGGPYDVTQLLATNPTDPAWGPEGRFHHWGQSELGYYLSNDEYVMRKHAYMIANADVDVIVFDVTNGFTYKDNYMTLCSVFMDIRAQGGTTPQICFMTNYNGDGVVQTLYDDLYSKNLYPELWFYWKGKPLILTPITGDWGNHSQAMLDFFTMRYSWTWMSAGYDTWKWMDYYPQQYAWHESPSIPEELSVSVGIVPHGNGIGRSFHDGSQPSHDQYGLTGTEDQGYCFAEQWSRLNDIDPEFLFITGWNEWVAQRQVFNGDGSDPVTHFIGEALQPGDTWFIDTYNQEFSRDIEPMKGGHTDNYYYQMIDGIRRYKGIRPPQSSSAAKTITIDGSFTDWDDVGPEYRDWVNDTTHRNSIGWGSAGTYTNTTGRNDFITAKVARDDTYIYFYIETAEDITPYTDPNWMMLFINTDQDYDNGWEGYDYVINMAVNSATSTTLKTTTSGWNWTDTNTNISYQVSGSKMEIRVPRSDIGQGSGSDPVAFDFHLADNIQVADDIIEFSVSGDSGPDRRFNYRYQTD